MTAWVCLMYHDVTPAAVHAGGGSDYFSVSLRAFEAQLDQLAASGYRVCSVEQAVDAAVGDSPYVACSFDDGDAGQYERAFPALAKRGMSATFFITTDWVGRSGFVSWDGLREMKSGGMSLQSHTRSHPFLSELDAGALRDELDGSRLRLDEELSQRTTSLAFPGGDPPRRELHHLIAGAGYAIVATSRWGLNRTLKAGTTDRPLWINRCTVRGEMAAGDFQPVIDGDRWLARRRALRETALRTLRNSLGPTRYARWRRRFLDRAASAASPGGQR